MSGDLGGLRGRKARKLVDFTVSEVSRRYILICFIVKSHFPQSPKTDFIVKSGVLQKSLCDFTVESQFWKLQTVDFTMNEVSRNRRPIDFIVKQVKVERKETSITVKKRAFRHSARSRIAKGVAR